MEACGLTLRSALISTKGRLDLNALRKDYKMLMGEDIPFKKFNYTRIEDFLKDLPQLIVIKDPNGMIYVDAAPTEKSAHIASLVNRQKSAPKKKSKTSLKRSQSQRRPRQSRQVNWRPAASGKKWQPSYEQSSRPAAVAHNQIIKKSPQKTNQEPIQRPEPPRRTNSQKSKPSTLTSPRSRAGIHNLNGRGSNEDLPAAVRTTPSPPPLHEAEKGYTTRLRRTYSTPVNGISVDTIAQLNIFSSALQQAYPGSEVRLKSIDAVCPRPRMRSQANYQPTPAFTAPNMPSTVQFTTPKLMNSQEEEQLRLEAIAAWNSSSSVCNSSVSDSDSNCSVKKNTMETQQKYMFDNDAHKELVDFVNKNKLGELVVKNKSRNDKATHRTYYMCAIKIDGQTYSSYPDDYISFDSALTAVSKKTLTELKEKYVKSERLLLSTEKDILERIPPIIESHYHGVWAEQIELDYLDMFKEQLPANWLNLLDTLPTISVDSTQGLEGIEKKYVLRFCKFGEKINDNTPLASDVSVPSNTVQVSETGCVVEVCCAISTIEIWLREIDTEESMKYEKLSTEMESFYNAGKGERCTHINCSGFYVVNYEDTWCRVRAITINEDDVLCFFIDYGDEHEIPKTNIYRMERRFARQQAQAFVCSLAGLEELVNVPCSIKHLEQIVGKIYCAKPIDVTDDDNTLKPVFPVVLYDLTESGANYNVNQELIKLITIDSAVCNLDSDNINKVYVTHAEPDGVVYVQPHCDGYDKFNDLMEDLQNIDFNSEVPNLASTPNDLEVSNRLFLTKWKFDDKYYRCIINDIAPTKEYAQIFFVDYGNMEIITLAETALYPLDSISDVLFIYPYLAIKVRIDIEPDRLPPNFATKLLDAWSNNQLVLLKVFRMVDKDYYCDLFKRSTDDILISAKSSLELEKQMSNDISEDTNNNNDKSTNLCKKLQRLKTVEDLGKPVPSTGLLKPPELPSENDWFEIKIPCAVNPWNFFVQPYATGAKLQGLMKKLQDKFKVISHSPISIDDIVPGKIYASKHEDGFWYRTSVIKVIHSGSISVFYCDFGFYANLKLYQLVPLDEEFMSLPFQAIKAKLHGIKPKNDKWSMSDCKYFEKLVCKRQFVSKICSRQNDELYKYDMVLSLKIIDTGSSDKDIEIDKLLIERGIAVSDK